jgi:hypothetical protein
MSAAMSAAMSEEDKKEAIELRSFAAAYETVLTEVMMSGNDFTTHAMRRDMSDIIRSNSNPLIKVELLMERLKKTEFGKRVMVMAILANDHGLAERVRKSQQAEHARLIEEAEQHAEAMRMRLAANAAIEAANAAVAAAIEADKIRISQGIPYGTYTESSASSASPLLTDPFTIVLPRRSKKGGKKSVKKGGKKSVKKGGKKSHKKSHRRRH